MKEILNKAGDHPILTILVVWSVFDGIEGIVRAVKGEPSKPMFSLSIGSKKGDRA